MPSRRRRRTKNVGTNLAEVQRRLRYLERRPIKTRLQRNVVTTESIAVNSVGPDEVSFGTGIVTSDDPNSVLNPKEGLLVVDPDSGAANVYSKEEESFIPVADPEAALIAESKSAVYYSDTAPVQDPDSPFAVGDTWFNTADGYSLSFWNGTAWGPFDLGPNAISSIRATQILAGSLASNVIVTSNLSAGQITTGTLTGITIQTSAAAGRQIQITNQDDIIFYKNGSSEGIITGVDQNFSSGDPLANWDFDDGVMMSGNAPGVGDPQGAIRYPAVVAAYDPTYIYSGIAGLFGNNRNGIYADTFGVTIQGDVFQSYADRIDLASGYGDTDGLNWSINIIGRLVFGYDQDYGPLSEGTGAPTYTVSSDLEFGQVVFRYTDE